MLSINTNLSSIIAQHSMNTATAKLNQAIERMTTGAKINHAKDNAAGYSIATNMTTKMNSYMVAQDNVAIGMEMVGTAESVISQMHDHAIRLRELATQARNNTYGADSLQAIQSEANARIAEIARLYSSSEFNGVSLYNRPEYILPDTLIHASSNGFINGTAVDIKPEYNGFLTNPKTYSDEIVKSMNSIDTFTSGANGEFKIEDADDLAYLATIVNDNKWDTTNAKFYLASDIDLKEWCETNGNWIPIGDYSTDPDKIFKGTFDGNGHIINNLKIDNINANYQGLFGSTTGIIKNLKLDEIYINGKSFIGGISGSAKNIQNCNVSGEVIGAGDSIGGLCGNCSYITNYCFSTVNVTGKSNVGSLCGAAGNVYNCFATGDVKGNDGYVGGLTGIAYNLSNCYATGNVTSFFGMIGGLSGYASYASNSYATGNVINSGDAAGGLIGLGQYTISNCYTTGNVTGKNNVGGLFGIIYKPSGSMEISSCYSLGEINGESCVGGLVGVAENTSDDVNYGKINITNCFILGDNVDAVGACSKTNGTIHTNGLDEMLSGSTSIKIFDISTNLQVGVNSDVSSQINFNTNFQYDLSEVGLDIGSDASLSAIDDFINILSAKETELGAVSNRLESVLDEIEIQYNNLASSRSTIRDADIAEVSSEYIKMQILQQASSTLLATANQTPSIALQLI